MVLALLPCWEQRLDYPTDFLCEEKFVIMQKGSFERFSEVIRFQQTEGKPENYSPARSVVQGACRQRCHGELLACTIEEFRDHMYHIFTHEHTKHNKFKV